MAEALIKSFAVDGIREIQIRKLDWMDATVICIATHSGGVGKAVVIWELPKDGWHLFTEIISNHDSEEAAYERREDLRDIWCDYGIPRVEITSNGIVMDEGEEGVNEFILPYKLLHQVNLFLCGKSSVEKDSRFPHICPYCGGSAFISNQFVEHAHPGNCTAR